jgi:hypothetical protein
MSPFPSRQYSNLTYDDLPVGTRVVVKNPCVDFTFFKTDEAGVVSENHGGYLGIIVTMDEPWYVGDDPKDRKTWHLVKDFNFNPTDLALEVSEPQSQADDRVYELVEVAWTATS